MKQLSIIPEIFIWLTFLVVTGFGYAFSFLGYMDSHAEISAWNIAVPTLIWFLLAAICTCLLRMARSIKCSVSFSVRERRFLEISILTLLLVSGWVFRFVDYFNAVWPKGLDLTYFNYAEIGIHTPIYTNPHPISRLYIAFLHSVCLLLGNVYETGALAQFLLLLVGVLIWYFAIRKAFGTVTALFFVAGAMLLPDSIAASMECNPMMLLFVLYGVIISFIVEYAFTDAAGPLLYARLFVIGIFILLSCLADISGVLMLLAFLGAAFYRESCGKDDNKNKFSDLFSILGIVAGGLLFRLSQMFLYDLPFFKAGKPNCYRGLSFRIPDWEALQDFAFSLGTHPVFIVAIVIISIYWFMADRHPFSWTMVGILYLLSLQLFGLDYYLKHDFLIYMALIVLLGIAVESYLKKDKLLKAEDNEPDVFGKDFEVDIPADLFDLDKEEEPVVREVRFEEEPAVEVPLKEEKPLIFIPKTMEIPKRVSKPKIDYAVDVPSGALHFDFPVDDKADFDID